MLRNVNYGESNLALMSELYSPTGENLMSNPNITEPKFGFNEYAERLNGRAAMIGFVLAIVIEAVTGQGVAAWLGLL
jgi:hypothetical protein